MLRWDEDHIGHTLIGARSDEDAIRCMFGFAGFYAIMCKKRDSRDSIFLKQSKK